MRGRKPRGIVLTPADVPVLSQVVRSPSSLRWQVWRARLVLALAAGERVSALAGRLGCDRVTVWRTARLYEHEGLLGLLTARQGKRKQRSARRQCGA
jgi:hypothetical protein